jgi:hypothetical protein
VLVSLTSRGRKLSDQGAAEIGRRVLAVTRHLTDNQRTQLTRLATAVIHAHPGLSFKGT